MGFQPFHIHMRPSYGIAVPPPAFPTAVPAMFEALLDIFAPLAVTLKIDDDDAIDLDRVDAHRAYGTTPLWCDEELTRAPLTSCKPDLGADVIAELYDRLANVTPKRLYVASRGALRHRADGTPAPAWYGRWRLGRSLHELACVTFVWIADQPRDFTIFDLSCPLSGYPFTSMKPRHRPELGGGNCELARENRELLMPPLCRVRAALGLDREEVRWGIDGHCFEQRDRVDLHERWSSALRAS